MELNTEVSLQNHVMILFVGKNLFTKVCVINYETPLAKVCKNCVLFNVNFVHKHVSLYHWHKLGDHLHWWQHYKVERGGGRPASFSIESWTESYYCWQCHLCHWRWWWCRLHHLNLVMGPFRGVLAIGWRPCCWESLPCGCCCPIIDHIIWVCNNVDDIVDVAFLIRNEM